MSAVAVVSSSTAWLRMLISVKVWPNPPTLQVNVDLHRIRQFFHWLLSSDPLLSSQFNTGFPLVSAVWSLPGWETCCMRIGKICFRCIFFCSHQNHSGCCLARKSGQHWSGRRSWAMRRQEVVCIYSPWCADRCTQAIRMRNLVR
jgi:hypothetical protein